MDKTMAVILLIAFALLLLCCVVVVAITVFGRTAGMVVARTRQEDLPTVLESVGRTLTGLVSALGRGIRQALSVGGQAGAAQPPPAVPGGAAATPSPAAPAPDVPPGNGTAAGAP
ncbi:hypothetical protein ACWGVR_36050 [Streptomyces xanthophaeus]